VGSIDPEGEAASRLRLQQRGAQEEGAGVTLVGPRDETLQVGCAARIGSRTMERSDDLEHGDRVDRSVIPQINRHGWVVDEILSDTGKVRDDGDIEFTKSYCRTNARAHEESGLAYVPAETTTSWA